MEFIFGMLLVLVFAVVTWCVGSEGAWGAGLTFLCVLFAGLLATNFFEPLADFIDATGGEMVQKYSDVAAFVGLFALFTFLLRAGGEYLSPTDLELDARAYEAARWLFAAAAGYTTMAILLTALHTAPLPREFLGFTPEGRNLFDLRAPDREWLGFVQHVSEKVLTTGRVFDGGFPAALETADRASLPQAYWPNFPIRYATRRAELASGGSVRKIENSPAAQPSPAGGYKGGATNAAF